MGISNIKKNPEIGRWNVMEFNSRQAWIHNKKLERHQSASFRDKPDPEDSVNRPTYPLLVKLTVSQAVQRWNGGHGTNTDSNFEFVPSVLQSAESDNIIMHTSRARWRYPNWIENKCDTRNDRDVAYGTKNRTQSICTQRIKAIARRRE